MQMLFLLLHFVPGQAATAVFSMHGTMPHMSESDHHKVCEKVKKPVHFGAGKVPH